jgi:hypothetical protein
MAPRLKVLLLQKHWQSHPAFKRQYERTAAEVDAELKGSYPSRTQLHRWTSGDVKRLPYADHCRVLEAMFPSFTIEELLEGVDDGGSVDAHRPTPHAELARAVRRSLDAPPAAPSGWGDDRRGSMGPSVIKPGGSEAVSHEEELGHRLVAVQRTLRLSDEETRRLAELAGNLVDLEVTVDVDIAADGAARVTFLYDLLNLTTAPIKRLNREAWFRYTLGGPKLAISALQRDERKVMIQRTHDTPNLPSPAASSLQRWSRATSPVWVTCARADDSRMSTIGG